MTDPSVQVELEQGIVEVGGVFRGRLQRAGEVDDLASGSKQRVRAVQLTLGYETEGRGDVSERTVAEERFPVDGYGRVDTSFRLAVPSNGPISYDGRLIRVLWRIEARVDVKLAMDRTTDIPVLVIPSGGWGLYHQPHPLPR